MDDIDEIGNISLYWWGEGGIELYGLSYYIRRVGGNPVFQC